MRRLTAVLFGGLLLTALASVPLASATTATEGHCTDDVSVTVVVDYQELGTTHVRCVSGLPAGSTGRDALTAAGFVPTGTIHDGPGFVCRIDGRPAADETLTVAGQPYRESCVRTPPSNAFWSYWHAPNGGSWTFSNFGVANREVIPGGYEGWSFSLNRTEQTNPAPRARPSHPVQAPTTTAPAPAPTESSAPATPTTQARPPTPSSPAPQTPRTSAPAPRSPAAASTGAESTSAAPGPSSGSPRPTSSPTRSVAGEPSGTPPTGTEPAQDPPTTGTDDPVTSGATTPPRSADPGTEEQDTGYPVTAVTSGEVPAGTLAGIGAVGAAAAGAGVIWWRRRQG